MIEYLWEKWKIKKGQRASAKVCMMDAENPPAGQRQHGIKPQVYLHSYSCDVKDMIAIIKFTIGKTTFTY